MSERSEGGGQTKSDPLVLKIWGLGVRPATLPHKTLHNATETTTAVDCNWLHRDGLSESLTFMTVNSENLLETADMRT